MRKDSFKVAITGMGALTAHGLGKHTLTNALQHGLNPFKISENFPQLSFPVIAAEFTNFEFKKYLMHFNQLPTTLIDNAYSLARRSPLAIQAALLASLEAWHQAELHSRTIDLTRVGIIVAGANTTNAYQFHLYSKFHEEPSYLTPSYALQFMDTDQVGILSSLFNIQGEGFTIGGASASGNMAIIQAYRLLQLKLLDICLVVGTLADLSPLDLQGFRNIGALGGTHFQDQPSKACRPFDSQHEGFIWGKGTGCLILESIESASNSNANILGHIAGVAMNLDGNHLSNPSVQGEKKAMQCALAQANLAPSDIQYINSHGSSSPLGDQTEVTAIKEVFNKYIKNIWINSTKSIVGHCIWSAGIIEVIATLLQLQENFVHPNLNLEAPIDPDCAFVKNHAEEAYIQAALSNSFGFGGINTSIVITKEH